MKFNPKIARTLLERENLTESTYLRWETKGVIPDGYFTPVSSKIRVSNYTLAEARSMLGKSQKEVCEEFNASIRVIMPTHTGILHQLYSLWERGTSKPSQFYATLLTTFFNAEFESKNIAPKPDESAKYRIAQAPSPSN